MSRRLLAAAPDLDAAATRGTQARQNLREAAGFVAQQIESIAQQHGGTLSPQQRQVLESLHGGFRTAADATRREQDLQQKLRPIAQQILEDTKKRLNKGSGNQVDELIRSGGATNLYIESIRKGGYGRPAPTAVDEIAQQAYIANHFHVGNCGENASLAYALAWQKLPGVPITKFGHSKDHAFVVIGDPADPASIVIDPWPHDAKQNARHAMTAGDYLPGSKAYTETGFHSQVSTGTDLLKHGGTLVDTRAMNESMELDNDAWTPEQVRRMFGDKLPEMLYNANDAGVRGLVQDLRGPYDQSGPPIAPPPPASVFRWAGETLPAIAEEIEVPPYLRNSQALGLTQQIGDTTIDLTGPITGLGVDAATAATLQTLAGSSVSPFLGDGRPVPVTIGGKPAELVVRAEFDVDAMTVDRTTDEAAKATAKGSMKDTRSDSGSHNMGVDARATVSAVPGMVAGVGTTIPTAANTSQTTGRTTELSSQVSVEVKGGTEVRMPVRFTLTVNGTTATVDGSVPLRVPTGLSHTPTAETAPHPRRFGIETVTGTDLFGRAARLLPPRTTAIGAPGREALQRFLSDPNLAAELPKAGGRWVDSPPLLDAKGKATVLQMRLVPRLTQVIETVPEATHTDTHTHSSDDTDTQTAERPLGGYVMAGGGAETRLVSFMVGPKVSVTRTTEHSQEQTQSTSGTETSTVTGPARRYQVTYDVELRPLGRPATTVDGGVTAIEWAADRSAWDGTTGHRQHYAPAPVEHGKSLRGTVVDDISGGDRIYDAVANALRTVPGRKQHRLLSNDFLGQFDDPKLTKGLTAGVQAIITRDAKARNALSDQQLSALLERIIGPGLKIPLVHNGHLHDYTTTVTVTGELAPLADGGIVTGDRELDSKLKEKSGTNAGRTVSLTTELGVEGRFYGTVGGLFGTLLGGPRVAHTSTKGQTLGVAQSGSETHRHGPSLDPDGAIAKQPMREFAADLTVTTTTESYRRLSPNARRLSIGSYGRQIPRVTTSDPHTETLSLRLLVPEHRVSDRPPPEPLDTDPPVSHRIERPAKISRMTGGTGRELDGARIETFTAAAELQALVKETLIDASGDPAFGFADGAIATAISESLSPEDLTADPRLFSRPTTVEGLRYGRRVADVEGRVGLKLRPTRPEVLSAGEFDRVKQSRAGHSSARSSKGRVWDVGASVTGSGAPMGTPGSPSGGFVSNPAGALMATLVPWARKYGRSRGHELSTGTRVRLTGRPENRVLVQVGIDAEAVAETRHRGNIDRWHLFSDGSVHRAGRQVTLPRAARVWMTEAQLHTIRADDLARDQMAQAHDLAERQRGELDAATTPEQRADLRRQHDRQRDDLIARQSAETAELESQRPVRTDDKPIAPPPVGPGGVPSLGLGGVTSPIDLSGRIDHLHRQLVRELGRKAADRLLSDDPLTTPHDNRRAVTAFLSDVDRHLNAGMNGGRTLPLRLEDHLTGKTYFLDVKASFTGDPAFTGMRHVDDFGTAGKATITDTDTRTTTTTKLGVFGGLRATAVSKETDAHPTTLSTGGGLNAAANLGVKESKQVDTGKQTHKQGAKVTGPVATWRGDVKLDISITRGGRAVAADTQIRTVDLHSLAGDTRAPGDPATDPAQHLPRGQHSEAARAAWRTAPGHPTLPKAGAFNVEHVFADMDAVQKAAQEAIRDSGGKVDAATVAALTDGLNADTLKTALPAMLNGSFQVPLPAGPDRNLIVDARLVPRPTLAGADTRVTLSGSSSADTSRKTEQTTGNTTSLTAVVPTFSGGTAQPKGQRDNFGAATAATQTERTQWSTAAAHRLKVENSTSDTATRPAAPKPDDPLTRALSFDVEFRIIAAPRPGLTGSLGRHTGGSEIRAHDGVVVRMPDTAAEALTGEALPQSLKDSAKSVGDLAKQWSEAAAKRDAADAARAEDRFWDAIRRHDHEVRTAQGTPSVEPQVSDSPPRVIRSLIDRADTASAEAYRTFPPPTGQYTIVGHGTREGIVLNGETLTATELAWMVRQDPEWTGQPITLVACDSAGFAADLARELPGVTVVAADGPVWTTPSGHAFVAGTNGYTADGRPVPDLTRTGHWQSFTDGRETETHDAFLSGSAATPPSAADLNRAQRWAPWGRPYPKRPLLADPAVRQELPALQKEYEERLAETFRQSGRARQVVRDTAGKLRDVLYREVGENSMDAALAAKNFDNQMDALFRGMATVDGKHDPLFKQVVQRIVDTKDWKRSDELGLWTGHLKQIRAYLDNTEARQRVRQAIGTTNTPWTHDIFAPDVLASQYTGQNPGQADLARIAKIAAMEPSWKAARAMTMFRILDVPGAKTNEFLRGLSSWLMEPETDIPLKRILIGAELADTAIRGVRISEINSKEETYLRLIHEGVTNGNKFGDYGPNTRRKHTPYESVYWQRAKGELGYFPSVTRAEIENFNRLYDDLMAVAWNYQHPSKRLLDWQHRNGTDMRHTLFQASQAQMFGIWMYTSGNYPLMNASLEREANNDTPTLPISTEKKMLKLIGKDLTAGAYDGPNTAGIIKYDPKLAALRAQYRAYPQYRPYLQKEIQDRAVALAPSVFAEMQAHSDMAIHALRMLPPAKNMTTWRGNPDKPEYVAGHQFSMKSLTSTSRLKANGVGFMPSGEDRMLLELRLNGYGGRDIDVFSVFATEAEVLMLPGARFEVVEVKHKYDQDKGAYRHVVAQEIRPQGYTPETWAGWGRPWRDDARIIEVDENVANDPADTAVTPEFAERPLSTREIETLRPDATPTPVSGVTYDVLRTPDTPTWEIPEKVLDSYRKSGLRDDEIAARQRTVTTDGRATNVDHLGGIIGYDHRVLKPGDGRANVQDFTVRIALDRPDPALEARVRQAVDDVFNQGYLIGDDQFHVTVEFTPDGHPVTADGEPGTTQTHWNRDAPGRVLAHEIGHYLGLTDETADGLRVFGLGPRSSGVFSDDSVMAQPAGQRGPGRSIFQRHLDAITGTRYDATGRPRPATAPPAFDPPAAPPPQPRLTPEMAERYERDLAQELYHSDRVRQAAQRTVERLREVLEAIAGDGRESGVRRSFVQDLLSSSGQAGTAMTDEQIRRMLTDGNLREIMTAFYNGAYFNRTPPAGEPNLKDTVMDIVRSGDWDRARALGLNVAEMRAYREYLDSDLRAEVRDRLKAKLSDDPFTAENLIGRSRSWRHDIAEQKRNRRVAQSQELQERGPDAFQQRHTPLGRYEREYLSNTEAAQSWLPPGVEGPELPLPWVSGHAYFRFHPESEFWTDVHDAAGIPVIAGPSLTTARLLTAFRWLNVRDVSEHDFLAALAGWMMTADDHSMYEILRGGEIANVRVPELTVSDLTSADEMYTNLWRIGLPSALRSFSGSDVSFPPPVGRYSIVGHGTPDGVLLDDGRTVGPAELARIIRDDPAWQGQPIALIVCDAAGFAADLARELPGTTVTAAGGPVWTTPSGHAIAAGTNGYTADGRPVPDMSATGHWQSFTDGQETETYGAYLSGSTTSPPTAEDLSNARRWAPWGRPYPKRPLLADPLVRQELPALHKEYEDRLAETFRNSERSRRVVLDAAAKLRAVAAAVWNDPATAQQLHTNPTFRALGSKNFDVVMPALFDAMFREDNGNPPMLKRIVQHVFDQRDWKQADRLGLWTGQLREMRAYTDSPATRALVRDALEKGGVQVTKAGTDLSAYDVIASQSVTVGKPTKAELAALTRMAVDDPSWKAARAMTMFRLLNVPGAKTNEFLRALGSWLMEPGQAINLRRIMIGAEVADTAIRGVRITEISTPEEVHARLIDQGIVNGNKFGDFGPNTRRKHTPYESVYWQRAKGELGYFPSVTGAEVREFEGLYDSLMAMAWNYQHPSQRLVDWQHRNHVDMRQMLFRISQAQVFGVWMYTSGNYPLMNAALERDANDATPTLPHSTEKKLIKLIGKNVQAGGYSSDNLAGILRYDPVLAQLRRQLREHPHDAKYLQKRMEERAEVLAPAVFAEMKAHSDMTVDALRMLPPAKNMTSWRGNPDKKEYVVGHEFSMKSLTSTSRTKATGVGFMPGAEDRMLLELQLNGYGARDIDIFSVFVTEAEVLLLPGTRFRVAKVEHKWDPAKGIYRHITAREIKPKGYDPDAWAGWKNA